VWWTLGLTSTQYFGFCVRVTGTNVLILLVARQFGPHPWFRNSGSIAISRQGIVIKSTGNLWQIAFGKGGRWGCHFGHADRIVSFGVLSLHRFDAIFVSLLNQIPALIRFATKGSNPMSCGARTSHGMLGHGILELNALSSLGIVPTRTGRMTLTSVALIIDGTFGKGISLVVRRVASFLDSAIRFHGILSDQFPASLAGGTHNVSRHFGALPYAILSIVHVDSHNVGFLGAFGQFHGISSSGGWQ